MSEEPKWHAMGNVTPRYELRRGSEVLAVVSYSRAYGVWSTDRNGGFISARDARRWEEMRLKLPECPVVEAQS